MKIAHLASVSINRAPITADPTLEALALDSGNGGSDVRRRAGELLNGSGRSVAHLAAELLKIRSDNQGDKVTDSRRERMAGQIATLFAAEPVVDVTKTIVGYLDTVTNDDMRRSLATLAFTRSNEGIANYFRVELLRIGEGVTLVNGESDVLGEAFKKRIGELKWATLIEPGAASLLEARSGTYSASSVIDAFAVILASNSSAEARDVELDILDEALDAYNHPPSFNPYVLSARIRECTLDEGRELFARLGKFISLPPSPQGPRRAALSEAIDPLPAHDGMHERVSPRQRAEVFTVLNAARVFSVFTWNQTEDPRFVPLRTEAQRIHGFVATAGDQDADRVETLLGALESQPCLAEFTAALRACDEEDRAFALRNLASALGEAVMASAEAS